MSSYLVRGGNIHLSVINNDAKTFIRARTLPTLNIIDAGINCINYQFMNDYSLQYYEIKETIGSIKNQYFRINHLVLKGL